MNATNLELTPELTVALEAVAKAEQIAMRYFGHNPTVRIKPDSSPVTRADIEAEAAIVQTIRAHFPDHAILGEESGMSRADSDFMWIIDPIDGTKNFMRGIPLFGIEIALTHKGAPIVGVSSVPALGERLFAQKGYGAFLNTPDQPVHVSAVDRVKDAYINFGGLNRFIHRGEGQHLLRTIAAAGRVRSTGDAYAFHLLATGRCDAVIEPSISFWDIAALAAIVTAAGGECTDLQGHLPGMDIKSAVFSNGLLHQPLMDLYWGKDHARG